MSIKIPAGHNRLPVPKKAPAALIPALQEMQAALYAAKVRLMDGGVGYAAKSGAFVVTHSCKAASGKWRTVDLTGPISYRDAIGFVSAL